jgi:DNA-binding NtrC family response regulator
MSTDPILVVDDDDALRETLVAALESLPVEITEADSGRKAVEILQNRRFAVVVTDLVMKDLDGFAVLQKARESYTNCRVVMLTGHGSRDVAVQAMEQGATYYVEKPVDLKDLRTKVRKCLEDHQKDLRSSARSGSRASSDRIRACAAFSTPCVRSHRRPRRC